MTNQQYETQRAFVGIYDALLSLEKQKSIDQTDVPEAVLERMKQLGEIAMEAAKRYGEVTAKPAANAVASPAP